jgi:hypothetical protein
MVPHIPMESTMVEHLERAEQLADSIEERCRSYRSPVERELEQRPDDDELKKAFNAAKQRQEH